MEITMAEAEVVVLGFINRLQNLITKYIKYPTAKRTAFVNWVRNNQYLDDYWHDKELTKVKIKNMMVQVCTVFVAYAETAQCPDRGAILNLIRADNDLVDWCEKQGIIDPDAYCELTVTGSS
jgi:hypothetical protein